MSYVFLLLGGLLVWASSVALTTMISAFALDRFRDNPTPWFLISVLLLVGGAVCVAAAASVVTGSAY